MHKNSVNTSIHAKATATKASSTKDNGIVKVGRAADSLLNTKDNGKVHIGGAAIRF